MSTSVADNTTIVGDREYTRKDDFLKQSASSTSKGKAPVHDFLSVDDVSMEDRPFFIPIGKDGLIAALQRLDDQLIKVCC
jgi:hypothetical protein